VRWERWRPSSFLAGRQFSGPVPSSAFFSPSLLGKDLMRRRAKGEEGGAERGRGLGLSLSFSVRRINIVRGGERPDGGGGGVGAEVWAWTLVGAGRRGGGRRKKG